LSAPPTGKPGSRKKPQKDNSPCRIKFMGKLKEHNAPTSKSSVPCDAAHEKFKVRGKQTVN